MRQNKLILDFTSFGAIKKYSYTLFYKCADLPTHTVNLSDAEQYLAFLHSLSDMGAAMRHIMTHALIDSAQYKALMKGEHGKDNT